MSPPQPAVSGAGLVEPACSGYGPAVFFFSNRMGCGGSLLVSAIGTLLLLLVLGVINID